ncbi:MAG: protein ndvB, partial [Ilumatobacter sp.]
MRGRGSSIQRRVVDNGRRLDDSYRQLARAVRDEREITPASEWLVDNYPIVTEQLREIRDDLPRRYYRQLPKLDGGHLDGYPRVLGLAWAYVAHTDSRFDPDTLRRMVWSYQTITPLTIGELWAIAISLRIVLVESLRQAADDITATRRDREIADEIADRLLGLGGRDREQADEVLRSLRREPLSTAAEVQLFQRLRDQDPETNPAMKLLDTRLAALGTSTEEIVRLEHQRQAAMNVTVRNVITSMRLISWFDWAEFVESVSQVDAVLREHDPYVAMNFATRNTYRRATEELGRGSAEGELAAAREAVRLAADVKSTPTSDAGARRRGDPGYFLIGDGRVELEHLLGGGVPLASRLRRAYVRFPATGYLASVSVITLFIVVSTAVFDRGRDAHGVGLWLVAALAVVPVSDLAVAMVNRTVTRVLGPVHFARLDLASGIPSDLRTLVVVPTLLEDLDAVDDLVSGLEVHFLSNRYGDIRFALLTDWLDADCEVTTDDDELLAAAIARVEALNQRHGDAPGGGARFLVLHRRRQWNPSEGVWMGWERKRGKLEELNALLRGSTGTSFVPAADRPSRTAPPDVRYVITLDSDTRVPMGAASALVATIAHPLNQPAYDEATGRVISGYGVLQPRITPNLPTEHGGSRFQQVFGGAAGIDPYSSAVSDVYQDLFQEGSFTGKGIYDVDAFTAALRDRVPDNTLLSHDLFEGVFARAGLVTDIEL